MSTQTCKYKIRNWSQYNAALKKRGSLTIWIEGKESADWYNETLTGKSGASYIYSRTAIQCCLMVREVFKLPLRGTEGFMNSVFALAKIDLKCPDYTTLSRRAKSLDVVYLRSENKTPRHIVIDSTGLKVYGEGEWKVRSHGIGKRRTWRKLHLAVDVDSQEIIAVQLTENSVGDCEVLPDLLDQIDPNDDLEAVGADGAYDTKNCHKVIRERGAKGLIPPQENAVEWPDLPDGSAHPRTVILREINQTDRATWKEKSGYHKRSLSETAMFRVKQIFGSNLKNRLFQNQITEGYLRIAALNKMTALGMPDSIKIV
jgi:hypothetical protein